MFNTFFQTWNTGCRSRRTGGTGQLRAHLAIVGETAGSVYRKIPCSSDSVSTKHLHWVTWVSPGSGLVWIHMFQVWTLQSCPLKRRPGRINRNVVRKFIHDKTKDSIYLKMFRIHENSTCSEQFLLFRIISASHSQGFHQVSDSYFTSWFLDKMLRCCSKYKHLFTWLICSYKFIPVWHNL